MARETRLAAVKRLRMRTLPKPREPKALRAERASRPRPTLWLDLDTHVGLRTVDVGDTVTLVAKAKVRSKHQEAGRPGEVVLEIVQIGVAPAAGR